MILRYRLLGLALVALGVVLYILNVNATVELFGLSGPLSILLCLAGGVLVFSRNPAYLLATLEARITLRKLPQEEKDRLLRLTAPQVETPALSQRILNWVRIAGKIAVAIVLLAYAAAILDTAVLSVRLADILLKAHVLTIAEDMKFQAPTTTDLVLIRRAAEVSHERRRGISSFLNSAARKLFPSWAVGQSPFLEAAADVTEMLNSTLSSNNYWQASPVDRRPALMKTYESISKKLAPIVAADSTRSMGRVDFQEEQKALTTILGRLYWALSIEGTDSTYRKLARVAFENGLPLYPPLSAVYSGLGLISIAEIKWSEGPSRFAAERVNAAFEHYEMGLKIASSAGCARIRNNMVDACLTIICQLGQPATPSWNAWREFRSDTLAVHGVVWDRLKRILDKREAALSEALDGIEEAIRGSPTDGTYYATRGQIYALMALLANAAEGSGGCSELSLRQLCGAVGSDKTHCSRDELVERCITLTIYDMQTAWSKGYPLPSVFGNPQLRFRFGLSIFDDQGRSDQLQRLEGIWKLDN